VAQGLQLLGQLQVVVDLAVEHQHAVIGAEGLARALVQVDDRQTGMQKRQVAVAKSRPVGALPVRASPPHCGQRPLKTRFVQGSRRDGTGNTTHQ